MAGRTVAPESTKPRWASHSLHRKVRPRRSHLKSRTDWRAAEVITSQRYKRSRKRLQQSPESSASEMPLTRACQRRVRRKSCNAYGLKPTGPRQRTTKSRSLRQRLQASKTKIWMPLLSCVRSGLTIKLSDAGGPPRPNWPHTWPARVRSSDQVRGVPLTS